MPFKPGESGNSAGCPPVAITKIKWDLIDHYIAEGTKWAFSVVDGTAKEMKSLKDKESLDIKLKAYNTLVKLAPVRQQHSGLDGGPISTTHLDPAVQALAKEYEDKLKVEQLKQNTFPISKTGTNTTSIPS